MAQQIKLKDMPKNIQETIRKAKTRIKYSFYPVFVLYGITTILLAKLAQFLLF